MFDKLRQKLSGLFDSDGEDRGVSPVIGVILMVAITVILAAVIGAFVLNLGGNLNSAPQASMSISDHNHDDTVNNMIELRHAGGDEIEWSAMRVIVTTDGGEVQWTNPEEGPFAPGDRITITGDDGVNNVEAVFGDSAAPDTDGATYNFADGEQVTVTIIDRESGEIIFDQSFRG